MREPDPVKEVRSLVTRDWKLEMIHNHKEVCTNYQVCADRLAREVHSSTRDLIILNSPPNYVWDLIERDRCEVEVAAISPHMY